MKEYYDATKQLEAVRRRVSLLKLENEMRYDFDILSKERRNYKFNNKNKNN